MRGKRGKQVRFHEMALDGLRITTNAKYKSFRGLNGDVAKASA